MMPPEEHILFTAVVGADLPRPWLHHVRRRRGGQAAPRRRHPQRDQFRPVSRPAAISPTARRSARLGGLGDTNPPHLLDPLMSFGAISTGPEDMRRIVRTFIKYGVDLIKLNLSGEAMTPTGADESPMSEEEIVMAVSEAKRRGRRVCAPCPARTCRSSSASSTASRSSTMPASPTRRRSTCSRPTRTSISWRRRWPGWSPCATATPPNGASARTWLAKMGYMREARDRHRGLQEDASPRHPPAAGRRLRLLLDAARHLRQGPRILRQPAGLLADRGAGRRHEAGRPDHGPAPTSWGR